MSIINTTLGWLAVGTLNEHFADALDPDIWADDPLGTPGCVINCGPCKAMHDLDEGGRRELERLVQLTHFREGGWDWWDEETGQLRWDVLEAYWAGHKSCGMSNGVPTGCDFSEPKPLVRAS